MSLVPVLIHTPLTVGYKEHAWISESSDGDEIDGVVILNEVDIADTLLDRDSDGCGLSIGSNGILISFTNAAPLISTSVLVVDDIQGMTFSSSTQELILVDNSRGREG